MTGIAGHVEEPYLEACPRPQILFPAYVRGHNLAESFYASLPYLSWQTIVVGDPLAGIVPGPALSAEDLNPPRDEAMGLPRFFGARLDAIARSKKLTVDPSARRRNRSDD